MYAVVQTIGPKGEAELTAVPRAWLCMTKSGKRTVLQWPSKCTATEQQKMVKTQCLPANSWSRIECRVKRECSTLAEANAAVDEMSGSSSSACEVVSTNETSRKPIAMPRVDYQGAIAAVDKLLSPLPQNKTKEPSMLSQSIEYLDSEPSTSETAVSLEKICVQQYNDVVSRLERIEKQNNMLIKNQEEIITTLQQRMEKLEMRLDKMDSTLAENLVNLPIIVNKLESRSAGPRLRASSFSFEPVNSAEELDELETKLNEESFKEKMLDWMNCNMSGDRTETRMRSCLNLLFSAEFQCKCTWTGATRGGNRGISVVDKKNIKQMFKTVGTTALDVMNDTKLAFFFMRNLRNAKKRVLWNNRKADNDELVPYDHVMQGLDVEVLDDNETEEYLQ